MNILQFREANETELTRVAQLLADAFLNYPLFTIIEENKTKRYQLIYEIYYINAKLYMAKHKCFVIMQGQDLVAVALLKDLQNNQEEFLDYIRMGFYPLFKQKLLAKTMKYLKLIHSIDDPEPRRQNESWYLDTFAVSKKAQGLGLGSKILQNDIFTYIQAQGGGNLFLATNTRLNRKFYQKNGFAEYKEKELKLDGHVVKDWGYHKKISA